MEAFMIDPVAFTIFGIDIYWYGIIITLGAVLGVVLAVRQSKKLGYDPDYVYDFLFLCIPLALIGLRLYYVAFELSYYLSNPIQILNFRDGGLAIYGGIIGGIIALLLFDKFYKKPKPSFLEMCDTFAPSLILGQAIGRWGNFTNQEAYSFVQAPDWLRFPFAVYIEALGEWRLATFFYESFWNLCVFIFLLWYRKRKFYKTGDVFFLYVCLYSFGRMIIEGLRADSLWLIPNMIRVSQLLAFVLVIVGIAALIWNHKRKEKPLGV